jgi:hypothetical protein
VREADAVATYRVSGPSGRLEPAGRQDLGEVHQLVGDPDGRFVYAAHGPLGTADPSIAVYGAQADGSLALLSEAWSRPDIGPFRSGWTWLAAGRGRVYALWMTRRGGGGQHESDAYVTHAVTAGGELGPAYVQQFLWDDPGSVTLDAGADVLYKAAPEWWVDSTEQEGLTAHAVEDDGRLRQMGWSELCGELRVGRVEPFLSVRGWVFGGVHTGQGERVCSWQTLRLASRGSVGDVGTVAAGWAPSDETSPAMLAFAKAVLRGARLVRSDLRLMSLAAGPELVDLEELPTRAGQLLFHPSGRFLYVSGGDGSLRVYAASPQGGLLLVEDLPDSGGAPTPFVGPARSLAVSVRPSVPRL